MFQTNIVEKTKTQILCSITFFENRAVYEDNVEKYGGARGHTNDVTIWVIRVACWISKAIRTHTPTRQGTRKNTRVHTHTQICNIYWFFPAKIIRERASVLRYTYIAYLC